MATRLMPGAISRSKSSILLPIDASDVMKPVVFPPGRGSPATNPSPTGSVTTTNTIGIVRVSRWSAAVTGVPCARIKSGCMATSSFAKVRILPTSPPPQRTSVRRFVPSDQPRSASPCVNPKSWAFPSGSFSPKRHEHADPPHPVRLLRECNERPCDRCAAKQAEELSPSQAERHLRPLLKTNLKRQHAHRKVVCTTSPYAGHRKKCPVVGQKRTPNGV